MIKFLKNEIIIDVAKDSFEFKKNDRRVRLQTVLWLSEGPNPVVLEVGRDYAGAKPAKKVMLFENPDVEGLDRIACLQSFLLHGFSQVLTGFSLFVRPKIIFKNSWHLSEYFSGREQDVLRSATMSVRARSVRFE